MNFVSFQVIYSVEDRVVTIIVVVVAGVTAVVAAVADEEVDVNDVLAPVPLVLDFHL